MYYIQPTIFRLLFLFFVTTYANYYYYIIQIYSKKKHSYVAKYFVSFRTQHDDLCMTLRTFVSCIHGLFLYVDNTRRTNLRNK